MNKCYFLCRWLFVIVVFNSCTKSNIIDASSPTKCKIKSIKATNLDNNTYNTITFEYYNDGRLKTQTTSSFNSNNIETFNHTETGTYDDNRRSINTTYVGKINTDISSGSKTIFLDDNGNAKSLSTIDKMSSDPMPAYDTIIFSYNSNHYLIKESSPDGTDRSEYEYFNGNRISSTDVVINQNGITEIIGGETYEYTDKPDYGELYYSQGIFSFKKGLRNRLLVQKIHSYIDSPLFPFNYDFNQINTYESFNDLKYPTRITYTRTGNVPFGLRNGSIIIDYYCD